ncbi:DUF11 domain-containing protein [Leptolyngbya sp. FACHB-261]|uniref:DUF11 domain-containing protein n=1 Tax=Leptolyngbya sp. FACHB-261 TaxID=2692806 RepID=UPI0016892B96|nr:DUF11 domain-containing protein [Leptolyngbya sp. FACHB-261]MBD2101037.1 DUF11 domain-containing protein [Leptolyngbya sp. FACHB-261]
MSQPRKRHSSRLLLSCFNLLAATLLARGTFPISVPVLAQSARATSNRAAIVNQASYSYTSSGDSTQITGTSTQVLTTVNRSILVDPLGRITDCAGSTLADYRGFRVALYEANSSDPTGSEIGRLLRLTQTELPNIPNNGIPEGITPNRENSNPFFIAGGDEGTYSFLLSSDGGQLDPGRSYILLINPPEGSIYSQRRVKITIGARNGRTLQYTATSLDGKPISATDRRTSMVQTINIEDAEKVGLNLAVLGLNTSVCQSQEIQIIKTGDRAAAEPGDTVIYRLLIKNLANSTENNIVVTDRLPLGFNFLPDSVRGELQGQRIPITAEHNGSTVTFRAAVPLPPKAVLNIAYAAQVTPDALRGNGRNSAIVNARRNDNNQDVKDGPAVHQLRLRGGILTDCGTLIGRVFVDKNFDGEQQPGEPGVPNAVIFMDDGNRITTDANGLFSVANVISGHRTGVLDLSSLPGYTLAPNLYFSERNSQSRLVHLAPGGLVRMNFAVTPTFQEQSSR